LFLSVVSVQFHSIQLIDNAGLSVRASC